SNLFLYPQPADGEESVLEPVDEEAIDSPQTEELDDNYLFMPTKEKTVKELIEFFHFWKKKKAQPNMCFTGIRSPALTNDADDKKTEAAKSKKTKKAEPDPLASDGDNGPISTHGTKYTGSCKFCSDGIVDNQTTEIILNIAQNMDFQQACPKCRLHYLKYCYMPGRGKGALSSPTESNKKAQPPPKLEVKKWPECFCIVSPTYASCLNSPEHSLNGHEQDRQEEVKDEAMESAEETKEDVKSPLEQSTLSIPGSCVDTKAGTTTDVFSAEQSRELEAAIPHQAASQSTTAGYGNLTSKSPDGCARTDVPARVPPPEQATSAPVMNLPPEYEQIFKSCGLEKLQALIQTGHMPLNTNELMRHYLPKLLAEAEQHQQPMNLMTPSGGSSGCRPPIASNVSLATSQPTMTTHARGTFYPPTGVPPPSSSSTQHHHRSQHQSGITSANQRQQFSAAVRTPSSNLSSSRPQYLPPQLQPTAPPPQNRNVLPENAAQFLRDQQIAAQRAAQTIPTTIAMQQHQLAQQYAALFNPDVIAMLSGHFKNPAMQYYLQQLLQRESQQRVEFTPEMYQAAMIEFYNRMVLSDQMRRASTSSDSGGGDGNVRAPQGPPIPQQQPAPPMSPFQHPTMNPTSSTARENAFYSQQRSSQQQQAQNLRISGNPAPPPPVESCHKGAPVFYPQLPTQQFQQQQLQQRSAQPHQQPQQTGQQQQPSPAQIAAYQQNAALYEMNVGFELDKGESDKSLQKRGSVIARSVI
ncbi:hypothetical protein ACTXT7_005528, partial [Hymenolepis weldensis]